MNRFLVGVVIVAAFGGLAWALGENVLLRDRVARLEAGAPLERCRCGANCPCKPIPPFNPGLPRRRDGALGDLPPERS